MLTIAELADRAFHNDFAACLRIGAGLKKENEGKNKYSYSHAIAWEYRSYQSPVSRLVEDR